MKKEKLNRLWMNLTACSLSGSIKTGKIFLESMQVHNGNEVRNMTVNDMLGEMFVGLYKGNVDTDTINKIIDMLVKSPNLTDIIIGNTNPVILEWIPTLLERGLKLHILIIDKDGVGVEIKPYGRILSLENGISVEYREQIDMTEEEKELHDAFSNIGEHKVH